VLSIDFPVGLSPGEDLFPEKTSTYTASDGTQYDVPCYVPGAQGTIAQKMCPVPFTNPAFENSIKSCVKPCPPPSFTPDEYHTMWFIVSFIGVVGFLLNLSMAATWAMQGWKHFQAVPYQLRYCVYTGLLYGVVGTFPSLFLQVRSAFSNFK
jgi:hypothetical protein